jgi:hypothetical protein
MSEQIVSSALYAAHDPSVRISPEWVEAMEAFLDSKIPVNECSFHDTEGRSVGPGPFHRLRDDIRSTASRGLLRELSLYSHRQRADGLLLGWQGCAFAEFPRDVVYLGVAESAGVSVGELARFLYASSKAMANWRYGIGYLHPWDRGPGQYATGMLGHSGPVIPRSTRPEDSRAHKDRVMCWLDEMRGKRGKRRHLQGWFRDVYPVNLLSEAHVKAPVGGDKALIDSGLGTFAQLDRTVWLWEVPQETIPDARQALIDARVLICR